MISIKFEIDWGAVINFILLWPWAWFLHRCIYPGKQVCLPQSLML